MQISLPAQASIWETRDAVATAERILRAHPDVRDTYWSVGEGAPRTYYNVMTLNDGVASFAGGWVDTTSPEATRAMLPALQRDLSEALPQAQVLTLPFEQGPPFEAPIEIRVVGPELDTLRRISDELRLLAAGAPLYAAHHGVEFSDAALEAAVRLSPLLPTRKLPDIAIDLLDTTGARMQLRHAGSKFVPVARAEQIAETAAGWLERPLGEGLETLRDAGEGEQK